MGGGLLSITEQMIGPMIYKVAHYLVTVTNGPTPLPPSGTFLNAGEEVSPAFQKTKGFPNKVKIQLVYIRQDMLLIGGGGCWFVFAVVTCICPRPCRTPKTQPNRCLNLIHQFISVSSEAENHYKASKTCSLKQWDPLCELLK